MKAEKLLTQIGASQADKMAATKMAAQREDTHFLPTAISTHGALNCVPGLDGEHKSYGMHQGIHRARIV
jgi:hypothetical protein